ncbi:hypothetical protein BBJ28_00015174 [Nothophytophthora sp. Chile5]|nr:hypothetical protein BBJ28_00015174 [Nothophytophthora sp. Chile5]
MLMPSRGAPLPLSLHWHFAICILSHTVSFPSPLLAEMNVLALIASGAVVLASVPAVLGHGYIVDPAATWKDGYAVNGWGSSIDNNMWGAIDTSVYGYGTDATVAFWKAMYDASGYASLGQFIDTNQVMYSSEIDEQCGYTVYDDTARETMPATNLTYTGFTHPGPCEVWCDDTVVLFDYNCQDTYPDIPAGIPYDESLCADANRFTIYWLGVHGAPWQVFTDCVWLENGSGSGSAPSPVTEAVSADVVTAPPTSGSGSTLTATTALDCCRSQHQHGDGHDRSGYDDRDPDDYDGCHQHSRVVRFGHLYNHHHHCSRNDNRHYYQCLVRLDDHHRYNHDSSDHNHRYHDDDDDDGPGDNHRHDHDGSCDDHGGLNHH